MSLYCWGEYPNIRKSFLFTLNKALYTLNKDSTASMLNWNNEIFPTLLLRYFFKVGGGMVGYLWFWFSLRWVSTEACIQRDICKASYVPASMIAPQVQTHRLPEGFAEGLKLCMVWSSRSSWQRLSIREFANKCVPQGVSQRICQTNFKIYIHMLNTHRKNCETVLFKVWIVENVFCRKEVGRKGGK